ncbi:MAG: tetratricopeptide repeat protein [Armatimonadota bacterium]
MIEYINGNKLIKRLVYVLVLSGILTLLVECILPICDRAYRSAQYRQWNSLMDKGSNLLQMGEVGAAIEPSESALRIARLLGYKFCLAVNSHQLGIISELRGNYTDAANQYQVAVNIMDDLPKQKKRIIGVQVALSTALVKLGRLDEADKYASQAVSGSKSFDENRLISSLETLAYVRETQERFKEAEAIYRSVLVMNRSGKESKHEAACLIKLGYLHCHMKRYDEAWPEFNEALKIARRRCGPYHHDTAEALYALSYICFKRGQIDKASALSTKAILIAEKTLGPHDVNTLRYMLRPIRIEVAKGNYATAKGSLEKLIATYERYYGSDNMRMVPALEVYESTLRRMGLATQARVAHRRVQEIQDSSTKQRSH